MIKLLSLLSLLLLLSLATLSAQPISSALSAKQVKQQKQIITTALGACPLMFEPWRGQSERRVNLTRVRILPNRNRVELEFGVGIIQIGIREQLVLDWQQMVRDTLCAKTGKDYSDVNIALYYNSMPIERFIPNIYRNKITRDPKRAVVCSHGGVSLVRRVDRPVFAQGLQFNHIAVTPSHGFYYNGQDCVWKYQRPMLFSTVEDLNMFDYTYRYLIPMLENAGAVVLSARERAPQRQEFIVDNDLSHIGGRVVPLSGEWCKERGGFLRIDTLLGENPFELGSTLVAQAPARIEYRAKLPGAGRYMLSVSYKLLSTNLNRVIYRVAHKGGVADIEVNQRMMGGSWVYLGEFDFSQEPVVTIIGEGQGSVTADAVRFGGGMGSVSRNGSTGGVPRWAQAARYSMQYSGVPESIYAVESIEVAADFKGNAKKPAEQDYVDDYKSRGDWANWVKDNQKVPLDALVALHSNAGVNDTIFGTLTIHFTDKGRRVYSNSKSSFAGRDMADIVLTQVVDDLRALHTEQWTRRSLYDRSYAEISRPDLPAVIVEMFSHQDPVDMRYATDPKFKFDMSRAIYKGILRFIADREGRQCVVQPLAVRSLRMQIHDQSSVLLSWSPSVDPIESTAAPTFYKLYTRVGEHGGFDNGVVVRAQHIYLPVVRDSVIRSYRITALNSGGESFGSEVLSCGFVEADTDSVVVVDNECRQLSAEVPYIEDLGYVGEVYNSDPCSVFVDNNNPGYGASHSQSATIGRQGESFDNTVTTGARLLRSGRSYISVGSR